MAERENSNKHWWAPKFGIWLALLSAAGGITYAAWPGFFPNIVVPL